MGLHSMLQGYLYFLPLNLPKQGALCPCWYIDWMESIVTELSHVDRVWQCMLDIRMKASKEHGAHVEYITIAVTSLLHFLQLCVEKVET
jgi:hypothetical protein